jgi:hypothetical protein
MPLCKKDRTDLCSVHLTSCLKEHQESICKVVGCFGSDRTYKVFPKKLQLNLLRRGTALNAGAGRGRWDLVGSNCNDEEESSGEDLKKIAFWQHKQKEYKIKPSLPEETPSAISIQLKKKKN